MRRGEVELVPSPRTEHALTCLFPQSTKAVYDRILDLRIATPQIVINYAMFLEEHKYFEESFKEEEDLPYEEEIMRNQFSVKCWLRYIEFKQGAPKPRLNQLYERALKLLPCR